MFLFAAILMMSSDLFAFVNEGMTQLITQHTDLFEATGFRLFHSFALIVMVWFGVKSALDSASGGGMDFGRFASLLLRISFAYAMSAYYNAPIPGLGISFVHLITDQSQAMVKVITGSQIQEVFNQLTAIQLGIPFPTFYEVGALLMTFILLVVIVLAEAAVFAVIAYGYAALGVVVLLGPIFVPFFIVPELEWMFWGWFRCFLQYSFYPVVASALVFVFGNVLLRFIGVNSAPLTTETLALLFGPIVVVLGALIYGVINVPSLVDGLFSGHSGGYALPRLWRRK